MSESKEENSTPATDVKEEDESQKSEENKVQDESSKDSEKDSVKEDSVKEESEKGSGKEDSDEEEEVGLLDRPVEVYGCRARKQVERLEISFTSKEKQVDIPEGKGEKLVDCPRIEFHILKTSTNDLKPLHRILFNRVGSGPEIKRNIRKFSGFTFSKESAEYDRKKTSIEKFTNPALRKVCEILDVERKGTKEDIVNRLLEFLMHPKDSGKKVPKAKQYSKDKKKTAEKKIAKKVKSKKEASSEDESNSVDESADEELNEDDEEDDKNDKDDGDSDEDTSKKTKTAKGKKTSSKTVAKKTEKKEKPKKEDKKTSKATKRKRDDSSDHSDEEPSSKKAKMPSDDDIKKLVKRILEAADLQEITMKKVIKQVSDAYPDSDLSHKKAFIKSTIKSVIS